MLSSDGAVGDVQITHVVPRSNFNTFFFAMTSVLQVLASLLQLSLSFTASFTTSFTTRKNHACCAACKLHVLLREEALCPARPEPPLLQLLQLLQLSVCREVSVIRGVCLESWHWDAVPQARRSAASKQVKHIRR